MADKNQTGILEKQTRDPIDKVESVISLTNVFSKNTWDKENCTPMNTSVGNIGRSHKN